MLNASFLIATLYIGTGILPLAEPTTPVTTIAAVSPRQKCLNNAAAVRSAEIAIGTPRATADRNWANAVKKCKNLSNVAYRPAGQGEPTTTPKPKRSSVLFAEVDRDPRGGGQIPRCSTNGPNLPGCTMRAAELARYVPPGRRGAPTKTQGGGTRHQLA